MFLLYRVFGGGDSEAVIRPLFTFDNDSKLDELKQQLIELDRNTHYVMINRSTKNIIQGYVWDIDTSHYDKASDKYIYDFEFELVKNIPSDGTPMTLGEIFKTIPSHVLIRKSEDFVKHCGYYNFGGFWYTEIKHI